MTSLDALQDIIRDRVDWRNMTFLVTWKYNIVTKNISEIGIYQGICGLKRTGAWGILSRAVISTESRAWCGCCGVPGLLSRGWAGVESRVPNLHNAHLLQGRPKTAWHGAHCMSLACPHVISKTQSWGLNQKTAYQNLNRDTVWAVCCPLAGFHPTAALKTFSQSGHGRLLAILLTIHHLCAPESVLAAPPAGRSDTCTPSPSRFLLLCHHFSPLPTP